MIKGKPIDSAMNDFQGHKLAGKQSFYVEEDGEVYFFSHSEFLFKNNRVYRRFSAAGIYQTH